MKAIIGQRVNETITIHGYPDHLWTVSTIHGKVLLRFRKIQISKFQIPNSNLEIIGNALPELFENGGLREGGEEREKKGGLAACENGNDEVSHYYIHHNQHTQQQPCQVCKL